jgi:hypothetical protein
MRESIIEGMRTEELDLGPDKKQFLNLNLNEMRESIIEGMRTEELDLGPDKK